MSGAPSTKGEDKGFSRRTRRIGADGPSTCWILHSFDNHDPLSMTCVADVHQPSKLCDKRPPLTYFTGNKEGAVMAFQCWNGKLIGRTQVTGITPVTALLVIPSHSLLWCGDENGGITVFRLSVEQGIEDSEVSAPPLLSCKTAHSSTVVCFATDGDNFVYSGSIDGILSSWKLQETLDFGKNIGQHTGELSQILTVGNEYLLSVGPNSSKVHVWSLEEKARNLFTLCGHTGGVLCSLYIEDSHNGGGALWTGGDDCFIRIWDLKNPVHLNSRIASNSIDVKMLIKDYSISEGEEEMDDSMQDNSIRVLIGHKGQVVALREVHGIVFSFDVSGSFLAWNPDRYWLLHVFSVPLGTVLGRTPFIAGNGNGATEDEETFSVAEVVSGARCLGFVEGFHWIIDTLGGPQCIYMPSHPRLRKSLCYSEADIPGIPNEVVYEGVAMNRFANHMQETLDLFIYYTGLRGGIFTTSVNSQLLGRNDKKKELPVSPAVFTSSCHHVRSSSSSSSSSLLNSPIQGKAENNCNDIFPSEHVNSTDGDNLQIEQMDLERGRQRLQEEAIRLEGKAMALTQLQAELIDMKKQQECRDAERDNIIHSLMRREQEREHQMVQVTTELSFLRLKYADWDSVVGNHFSRDVG